MVEVRGRDQFVTLVTAGIGHTGVSVHLMLRLRFWPEVSEECLLSMDFLRQACHTARGRNGSHLAVVGVDLTKRR